MTFNLSKKIRFWLRAAGFCVLLAYIGYVTQQQPFDWAQVQAQFRTVAHPERWAALLLLLAPVNWGLEALKWQWLLRRVETVSFADAYRGILAGMTLSFALPAQLGDVAGRVLSLRSAGRGAAVGASMVAGGMQFYVTLVLGTLALAWHLHQLPIRQTPAAWWLLGTCAGLSVLGVAFGLLRQPTLNRLARWRRVQRFSSYWTVAGAYTNAEIGLGLGIATLRYGIFALQFYVALRLVGIQAPVDALLAGIGLIYLIKNAAPPINMLSDLGVREAAALWVFAPLGLFAPVLLTATLTLWLVNVLTPVLIGLIWVWRLNLATE
ncbi:lysylphosphatidylglycerol synthase-like protein [Spirosoma oryzae]|uniref:Lysylphosphatidylglycerol synthase-like protein n=1 Tax=Spirosoma oryzae TaxID=1469603 RepID=A0A2T0TN97_9BACT|nr:lysylphosphatidylglycerol synthase domain-containing protein [Spirosoma oryzae]PRY47089.1 lysylphosphatidylglycerol synthase-like protein [Spirosoma oryzae]